MISEYFVVLKKNRERVLSALIKNKYPDISESLKKRSEQTGGEQVMNCRETAEKKEILESKKEKQANTLLTVNEL